MVFKAVNSLAPDHLSSMFTERIESGDAITNSANKFSTVRLPRRNYLKKALVIEVQLSGIAYPVILDEQDHLMH